MSRTHFIATNSAGLPVVLTAFAFIYMGAAKPQFFISHSNAQKPIFVASCHLKIDFILDSRTRNWIKFQDLARQWRAQRGATSSITQMAMLPAYQKIIGMGQEAIPLILAQLRSETHDPDQWFWALRSLTDANPVRPEDQGNFSKMAVAWINWGEREGYAR
ncbi:MAG TPA: hypothetical protein VFC39_03265 [Acidobacteriaceae bacterium]|nr:hypothetical protein [Acidobacteriaceae bacterium]